MKIKGFLQSVVVAAILADPSLALDYGTYGALFPVEEPSVLETIFARLSEMEQTGELDQMRRDMQDRTRARVMRPVPVMGLRPAEEYRRYEVDLSITLDRDLSDHRGVVFARAGTRINPLDYSRFDKRLIFIDGDVPEQVAFALETAAEHPAKIILVSGAPLELTERHDTLFWFDQGGMISAKFQLGAVPAVVSRGYPTMIVEEIPVEEDKR